ncbi:hypothetical protein KAI65_06465 [Candidatus Parcubacteria bacterium]|nr:hypothetical protein [Candidatus Parcubacteria bacterium]
MFKIINKQPNSPVYFSRKKVKLSGYVLEVANFEHEFMLFYRNKKNKTNKHTKKIDSRNKALTRAKRIINDYINSNVWHWLDKNGKRIMPLFITLTYRENIQDLDYANNEFTKFIRRFNYEFFHTKKSVLKYLCVIEFQKRGSIHYHMMIFNLPFKQKIYDRARSIWPFGSCNIKSIKSKQGAISGYLVKYLTKEKTKESLRGRKCYFISRNLHKPIESSIEDVVLLIENNVNNSSPFYQYERIFKIGNKQQTKNAKLYDLKNKPKKYNKIINILKTYEY